MPLLVSADEVIAYRLPCQSSLPEDLVQVTFNLTAAFVHVCINFQKSVMLAPCPTSITRHLPSCSRVMAVRESDINDFFEPRKRSGMLSKNFRPKRSRQPHCRSTTSATMPRRSAC